MDRYAHARQVTTLARIAVDQVAPGESVAFDGIAAEWARRRGRPQRSRAAVGFGIDSILDADVILSVISAVLHELQTGEMRGLWQRWVIRRRVRTDVLATGEAAVHDPDRLRRIVRRHVMSLHPDADADRVDVLADAIVGAFLLPEADR